MNKRMMILILSLRGGGAERVASILSSVLADRGEDVHVVIYERKDNECQLSDKVKFHLLKQPHGDNKIWRLVNRIRGLRNLIKEINPDVIIPFLALPTVHAYFATRGLGIRFIATVRNNPILYPNNKKLRNLVNWITKQADGIMLQTEGQRTFFEVQENKTFVVCNPVKQEMLDAEYQYNEEAKVIATFGRLNEQKNHALLIKAFAKVTKKYPSIVLNIWGEGEEKSNLEQQIAEMKLEDKVFLQGNTPDVKNELVKTDIFVLSSDYEGLPNALMEAMAVGLPCISTDCPTGPRDLIKDSENGLLVSVGSDEAMADAMIKLLDSAVLREQIGQNAAQTMRLNYSAEIIADKFMEAIWK